jgi:nucleotide-binding universal stress UspA family protein
MSIVVGVDGSEGSLAALRWAIAEARFRNTSVRAVLAWSYLDQPGEFDPHYDEASARRGLDAALDGVAAERKGVEIDPVLVCDLPVAALLDASRDADMVVVGSRGLGGVRGLLLGSVSRDVAHRATCPVVIIPGPERREHREE